MELFDYDDENGFDNQTDLKYGIDSRLDEIYFNKSIIPLTRKISLQEALDQAL